MKRDALRKLLGESATDELVDSIMALYGQSVEKLTSDLSVATSQVKTLQNQLSEASSTIDGFKKMDIESIQKSAAEWEAKYIEATEQSKKALADMQMEFYMTSALRETFKARDPKDLFPLLDRSTLKVSEDGTVTGLEDQVKVLRESKPYLFSDEKEPPKVMTGGNNQSLNGDAFEAALYRGAQITKPT